MTLENFPETFTHMIASEVETTPGGHPVSVLVHNFGSLSKDVVRAIALEAVAAWEGRYSPYYLITGWEQTDNDVVRVYVTNV